MFIESAKILTTDSVKVADPAKVAVLLAHSENWNVFGDQC